MRKAIIYRNGILAGELMEESRTSYIFQYSGEYYSNINLPAISLTMPKTQKTYRSDTLFPFFFNMLSEGVNKKLQCQLLRVDENDHFGLLLAIAGNDTIGPITVKQSENDKT
ncbi:MAG TPA: HipA N-terminal domain-containing protein [Bacteroidales bacterium]|nr:HipA N-terminal domain-containing protein [Bacteroidales bacterium]